MDAANLRRALRVVIAAASGLAIAVTLTVAAPGAQAAGSLTGPASAGVSQSVTVTLSSPSEGVNLLTPPTISSCLCFSIPCVQDFPSYL